jgi:hypothetical protein
MALFFTVLLGISIAGLVGLLAVKRWELSGGRVVMGSLRPAAGRMLGEGLHFVERQAPQLVRAAAMRAYAATRVLVHRLVAWVVLHTEHLLERTLAGLRGATQTRGEGEASEFLREVAEHKKSLLKKSARSKKQNAIYEE